MSIVFSSKEAYNICLSGLDIAHLIHLVDGGQPLHDEKCLSCVRIKKALQTAEFANLDFDGPGWAA